MKKIITVISLMLVLVMLVTACSKIENTAQATTKLSSNVAINEMPLGDGARGSINASNQLGYEVLKALFESKDGENLLFSPISLSMALAMMQNGAEGETLDQIISLLRDDANTINQSYNGILTYLNAAAGREVYGEADPIKVMIGNSLWFRQEVKPTQDFVDKLKAYYNAEVYKTDFASNDAVKYINGWIEDKTNGLLKDTISEINPDTIAYLLNTLYFKGTWINQFSEYNTFKRPFTLANGSKIDVDMMHETKSYGYFGDDKVQIAALPYHGGATMYVVLPKGSIESFIVGLEANELSSMIEQTKSNWERLELAMPKFEYTVSNPLKEILLSMGMDLPFSENGADFGNMFEPMQGNVYVSDIFQNATIIVDEEGTEAAAVTVIEFAVTSMPMFEDPIEFHVDRPFMYVIADDETGAVLFTGVVQNPSQN